MLPFRQCGHRRCNRRQFYQSTAIHHLDRSSSSSSVRIGSVEREIIRMDHLSDAQRQKIPCGYLEKLHISMRRPQRSLSHLQWLMQKDILRQDVILVGTPSTLVYRRRLVHAYAELIQRPIEHCIISPDTTESSLKQTRLLVVQQDTTSTDPLDRGAQTTTTTPPSSTTRIVFQDQAPVRAALQGHILILDGLQNAERNVLPTLNNLLENRELPLEDGRLLVSAERYAYLVQKENTTTGDFLVPVHPDFRVVALYNLMTTMHHAAASKLDPPVRSRFQIRRIDSQDAEECLIPWNNEKQDYDDHRILKDLMVFAKTINSESYNHIHNTLQFPVTTAMPGIIRLLTEFPNSSPSTFLERAYPYANSSESRLAHAFQSWSAGKQAGEHFQRVAMETNMIPKKKHNHSSYHAEYQFTRIIGNIPDQSRIRQAQFASEHMSVSVPVWSGGKEIPTKNNNKNDDSSFVATSTSQTVLTAMMQEHAAGRDILLLGPKGEGKSILAEQFANILGYQIHRFPLYKDMTASDLLVRRSHTTTDTTSSSSSQYVESPLLQAARTGQICVLDGVEKVSPATLGTLQSLLTDREIHLPDGTKLCQTSDQKSTIHPSFRVIALASIPSTVSFSSSTKRSSSHVPISWLTEDVTSMFSTISMPTPSRECLLNILRPQNNNQQSCYSDDQMEQILDLQEKLSVEDCGVSPLSMRGLLRLVRRRSSTTEQNLHENLCKVFLADLLTPLQRASLESVMRSVGIGKAKKNTPRTQSARTSDKTLEIRFDATRVMIGNDFVIKRQAAGTNPELVPNPFFFDIPSHVHMIQTLLSEWDSGPERSFLLLGNQGTGKNKICDRICQLANLEREYMQLHRDSTIGQLTLSPTLEGGKVVWKDSPLVRAIKYGRALVIDEADKAPLEVVAVLKSLVEDGELLLADGRRILRCCTEEDIDAIPIHPDFSIWVLANRPGRLFHGNDFYAEVGDCFSTYVIPNPDLESEIKLLQSYAPSVDASILRRIAASFNDLRHMFENGDITYPYSTREAVAVAKHIERFPNDDTVEILHNVLDLDSFDEHLYMTLGEVFSNHGFNFQKYDTWKNAMIRAREKGNGLSIEYKADRSTEGTGQSPPAPSSPKVGKWDDKNEAHVGGNQWAGGTGGSDTAGLGGRGGPYRLDRGHKVHQVSDEAKAQVSKEAQAAARRIAEQALKDRLKEIGMSKHDHDRFSSFLEPIRGDVANLRAALQEVEYKTTERDWIKRQLEGELDDSKLVEGIAGEKHVYKRRGIVEHPPCTVGSQRRRRKYLRFVVDCSGSMYRFEGYDGRLTRMLQATALVMEALDGMEDKFDYSIVGHSGDSNCIELVKFGHPPSNAKERLDVLETMIAHTQYCSSGDNTLGAIKRAVRDVSQYARNHELDDSSVHSDSTVDAVVIAISDANLERYGISPRELSRAMRTGDDNNSSSGVATASTKTFCIFIASFGNEAEQILRALPTNRGFVCMDPGELPATVRNILTVEVA